jgi:hypothetical protein
VPCAHGYLERNSRGGQANRARKYQARCPVWPEASAIAIDAEYTITTPIDRRSSALHDNDAS